MKNKKSLLLEIAGKIEDKNYPQGGGRTDNLHVKDKIKKLVDSFQYDFKNLEKLADKSKSKQELKERKVNLRNHETRIKSLKPTNKNLNKSLNKNLKENLVFFNENGIEKADSREMFGDEKVLNQQGKSIYEEEFKRSRIDSLNEKGKVEINALYNLVRKCEEGGEGGEEFIFEKGRWGSLPNIEDIAAEEVKKLKPIGAYKSRWEKEKLEEGEDRLAWRINYVGEENYPPPLKIQTSNSRVNNGKIEEYWLLQQEVNYFKKKKVDKVKINRLGKIYNFQKEAFRKMETAAKIFTSEAWKRAAVKPRQPLLLIGPSGVGKTFLAKSLADSLDWPFYTINTPNWVVQGGRNSLTQTEIVRFVAENNNGVIFLDELDKLDGVGDWTQHLRNEVFQTIDKTIPTTLAQESDCYNIEEKFKENFFVIGAGTWQSLWGKRESGFINSEKVNNTPSKKAMAQVIPEELLLRFNPSHIAISPLEKKDYEKLLEEVAEEFPKEEKEILINVGKVRIEEGEEEKLNFRWIESLVNEMLEKITVLSLKT